MRADDRDGQPCLKSAPISTPSWAALPELIAALLASQTSVEYHRLLSETYRQMGLTRLAQEYQNRAEILHKKETGR